MSRSNVALATTLKSPDAIVTINRVTGCYLDGDPCVSYVSHFVPAATLPGTQTIGVASIEAPGLYAVKVSGKLDCYFFAYPSDGKLHVKFVAKPVGEAAAMLIQSGIDGFLCLSE